jgi:hypothetical protein
MKAALFLSLGVASLALPAGAQTTPQQATPPMIVPLANQHLAGVIESLEVVHGEQHVVIRDDNGFDDDVTIANDARTIPSGSELTVGQRVRLTGYNAGSYFDATAVSIVAPAREAAPVAQAPAEVPPPPAPAPAANPLPSYAVPGSGYPPYAYAPVYVPVPVYAAPVYVYPVIGFQFYGGVRYPIYGARIDRGYPSYARPYGYRR